jgi:hypothetical protein
LNVPEDKEKAKARRRRWREQNPERWQELRISNRARLTATNDAWLAEYKRTHPCARCGEPDPRVLQFHHRDRSKKRREVSALRTNHNLAVIMAEVAKCDVLCANCHIITEWELAHPTEMYDGPFGLSGQDEV